MRRRGTWALTFVGLAAAAAGCPNDTRDAHCAPDAPSRDLDPSCIYAGNGKGPGGEPACALDRSLTAPAPESCPTFADVVDWMDQARGAQKGCADASCHGSAGTGGGGAGGSSGVGTGGAEGGAIVFDTANPKALYTELTTLTGSVGRPYVVPGADGWMYCNVTGTKGGGSPQPPPNGLETVADADLIRDWILCGAEGPE